MKPRNLFSVSLSIALIAGCATPADSNRVYTRSALNSATRTIEATVVNKRSVLVDASTGVGGSAGGALGAIGGSSIGGNSRDNLAGAVIGAVVGSAIGAAIESNSSKISAFEYIVKSDIAGLMTIIQTDSDFSVGQRVFVIMGAKPVIVNSGQ